MFFVPIDTIYQLSYSSIFGGATLFLTGMYLTTLKKLNRGAKSFIYLFTGLTLLIIFSYTFKELGGWQNAEREKAFYLFLFMPEILAFSIFIFLRGFFVNNQRDMKFNPFTSSIAFFGKISYSAYIFSLFTVDFISRVLDFISPGTWISMLTYIILYFIILTIFSSLSFFAIEKPFLDMRKQYVKRAHKKIKF